MRTHPIRAVHGDDVDDVNDPLGLSTSIQFSMAPRRIRDTVCTEETHTHTHKNSIRHRDEIRLICDSTICLSTHVFEPHTHTRTHNNNKTGARGQA